MMLPPGGSPPPAKTTVRKSGIPGRVDGPRFGKCPPRRLKPIRASGEGRTADVMHGLRWRCVARGWEPGGSAGPTAGCGPVVSSAIWRPDRKRPLRDWRDSVSSNQRVTPTRPNRSTPPGPRTRWFRPNRQEVLGGVAHRCRGSSAPGWSSGRSQFRASYGTHQRPGWAGGGCWGAKARRGAAPGQKTPKSGRR